jgi:hypothetical protein
MRFSNTFIGLMLLLGTANLASAQSDLDFEQGKAMALLTWICMP